MKALKASSERRARGALRRVLQAELDRRQSTAAVVVAGASARASAAAEALRSERQVLEAALGLLVDMARHCDFSRFPAAIEQFRAPKLSATLAALRAGHAELDRDAAGSCEEEITAVETLQAMLAENLPK